MQTLKQLLEEKGGSPIAVSPKDTVFHALGVMAQEEVGAVLVMDGERLVGIFTERDYARKVILAGRASKETPIEAIMTAKVAYVTLEQSLEDCMSLMTQHRFRHLPVLDGEQNVLGMISIGDLVKATISHQKFLIEQLEHYIAR